MIDIDDMKEEAAINLLKVIVEKLDELDLDDFFGSEGWKHHFGVEE